VADLTAELSAAQQAGREELEAHSKEQQSLAARVAALTAELSTAQHASQENGSYRSSLEAQLTADREYIHQLTAQIADLQREVSTFETRLLEQRQFAAKALEFLNQAQSNFSSAPRPSSNGAEKAHVAAAAE
jgi:chromosome segregation ATPase